MLQNAYFLAKIGADTAENEQHFAEFLPKTGSYPTGPPAARVTRASPCSTTPRARAPTSSTTTSTAPACPPPRRGFLGKLAEGKMHFYFIVQFLKNLSSRRAWERFTCRSMTFNNPEMIRVGFDLVESIERRKSTDPNLVSVRWSQLWARNKE